MSALLGVVGALVGVLLGGWLSTRGQVRLLKETQHEADRQFRAQAYIDYLTAQRRLRRFLLEEAAEVKLLTHVGRAQGTTPVIENAAAHWEAVERARSSMEIWPGADKIRPSSDAVLLALYDVARARASCPPGRVPMPIVDAARAAEHEFADAARQDLERL
jgi:hypothetical protein